jgi:hypothetical protein
MTATFFPPVRGWRIPERAVAGSLAELARDGREGMEGIALWLGRRRDGDAEVTHLVALRGPGVTKRPDLLRIEPWLLNDVTDVAIDLGVSLVGQIHSHGRAWVDLSWTDRADGVAVPHYLSVVAPWFGLRPGTRLVDCGVHVFEPSQGWRRLPASEVEVRLRVDPGARAPVITVGQE